MLTQVAQEAATQAPNLTPIYALLGPLALKAIADVGRELVKARSDRNKAKTVEAQAALEQAKAYGISLIKSKNGVPDKQAIVAFCPSHIDMVEKLTRQEEQTKFINEKLGVIQDDVKVIRGAMGK